MVSANGHELPLGKPTPPVSTYTPSLLRSISREEARAALNFEGRRSFHGEDVWSCYEFSWLNAKGRPEVAILRLQIPCSSPCLVESKSMKLYLNSFAQTVFETRGELVQTLDSDLALAVRAPVIVSLSEVDHPPEALAPLPGRCLDELDIGVEHYERDASLLEPAPESQSVVRETLRTNLFRSVCPVTGQPDWASVMIQYVGPAISREALLRYLISYRGHAAFHESSIEQIFVDVAERCACEELTVYGRFLRRGGIDINPFRSSSESVAPLIRPPRQ